jgi:protein-S-isoprenylcysteine O-methyltransferase Ste14
MMLAATGMFLLMPDALSFSMGLLAVAVLNTLVRLEEQFLLGVHGAPYAAYCARVGRFFPGLGLLRPPRTD